MIRAEALKVRAAIALLRTYGEHAAADGLLDVVEKVEPPSASTPRWIPVSERLPEPGVEVLGWDARQKTVWAMTLEEFADDGIEGATHWMPLPAPPEDLPLVGRAGDPKPQPGR